MVATEIASDEGAIYTAAVNRPAATVKLNRALFEIATSSRPRRNIYAVGQEHGTSPPC